MPRSVATTTQVLQAPKRSAIVASATIFRNSSGERRKSRLPRDGSAWQNECWEYRDTVGELRYAVSWFSNALSRARLHVATRDEQGELRTLAQGEAVDALHSLLGPTQAPILKAMGEHYFIAGEWYLIGLDIDTPDEDWMVVSPSEVTKNGDTYYVQLGNGERLAIARNDPAAVIRVHSPHPRNQAYADSPVRAVLSNLREITALSEHVAAQVRSRLAGAGVLWMPNEVTFSAPNKSEESAESSGDNDPFLSALGGAMMSSISEPGSPESLVPIIARVPQEALAGIQHMTFWNEISEKATEMRDAAIRRFALGIDLPPEVLLGTADVNHWGSWQIEESTIKAHIEPALEVMAAALTSILRDAVGDDSVLVVYDTSALRLRPNRSKEAMELYDRGQIKAAALLRETGFSGEDKMEDEERKMWLLQKIASGSATPAQVEAALRLLGVEIVTADGPGGDQETRETRPDPSLREHPAREVPEREEAALRATCDALVFRALERVGNRLKNQTRTQPPGVDPTEMYLHIRPNPKSIDSLLDGAWSMLPRLLGDGEYDPECVRLSLDAYTKGLLAEGREHSPEQMMRVVKAGVSS